MAKLAEKTNKNAEARQIASDLLKTHDYVLNPRDNTYQLINKATKEVYSGDLVSGLDADKGLLQKDRRLKRLVGEQLAAQRFKKQQRPIKLSEKSFDVKSDDEVAVKDGTTTTTDILAEDRKLIEKSEEKKEKPSTLTAEQRKEIADSNATFDEEFRSDQKSESIESKEFNLAEILKEIDKDEEAKKKKWMEEIMSITPPELEYQSDATNIRPKKLRPLYAKGGTLVRKAQAGLKTNRALQSNKEVVFGNNSLSTDFTTPYYYNPKDPYGKFDPNSTYNSKLELVENPKYDTLKNPNVVAEPEKESIWKRLTNTADTRSLAEKSLDYVNPILVGADYLTQRSALKNLGKNKAVRTYDNPTQLNVRAVSDMPYEVRKARENAISRMRSDYKGSDPVMELVSKQMVGAKQLEAREQLGSERAAIVAKDQARVDEQVNKNAMLAGQTSQKNSALKRQYDESDRLLKADIDNRQASLTGQLIGTTAQGLQNRLNTRDMAQLKNKDIELKRIQTDIKVEESILSEDPTNVAAKGRREQLLAEYSAILGEVGGKYSQIENDVMFRKDGGKLIPRK